ncbi:MAG: YeeE/YedE family protein [Myxococcaceae bacterium]
MTRAYWPCWAGALALSGTALTYFLTLGRTMGVSSYYRRLVDARRELHEQRELGALGADADALVAALHAATLEEMGQSSSQPAVSSDSTPVSEAPGKPLRANAVPWTAPALFLLMLVVGGAVAAMLRGGFRVQLTPGPLFEHFFSTGAAGLVVLLAGGLCVGFGTQMAGGCTSGHGLSGTARFQPGSLAATASFFGAGAGVSLLLARFL